MMRFLRRRLLLLPLLALLASCAPAAVSAPTTRPFAPPSDDRVTGVTNFARISPTLYRGAQPDAAGFANLKKLGIRTVVNLRSGHSDRDMLKGTGLKYVEIPCNAFSIDQTDVARVMKILKDPEFQPVFLHCQHGADRTGLTVGIYRMVEQGWSADHAEAELRAFGWHSVYQNILRTLRLLSKPHFERIVNETPKPKVVEIP